MEENLSIKTYRLNLKKKQNFILNLDRIRNFKQELGKFNKILFKITNNLPK